MEQADLLRLLNEITTDTIQIARTVSGNDVATVNSQGRVTGIADSSGVVLIGIGIIALVGILLLRK